MNRCRENRRASYEHKGENEDETPIAIALAMAVMRANAKDKHKDGDRDRDMDTNSNCEKHSPSRLHQGNMSPMDMSTDGSTSNTNTRHSGLWSRRSLVGVQEADHSQEHSSSSLSLLHPAAYDEGTATEDVDHPNHDGGYHSGQSSDSSNTRKMRKEMMKNGGRTAPVRVSKSRLASLMGNFHHPEESAD